MESVASRRLAALFLLLAVSSGVVAIAPPAHAETPGLPILAAAPAILSTTPADGAVVNRTTPPITVTYEPGNVTAVAFFMDGLNVTSGGAFTSTTFAWSYPFQLTEGPHRADFTLWDNTSASSSISWTFTVDVTAPSLQVTSPVLALTNQLTVPVAGFTDVGAIVTIDGVPVSVAPDGSFFGDASLANEGLNAIVVAATDAAGNVATAVKSVVRDTAPPALTVVSPVDGTPWNTSAVYVAGVTEPGTQVIVNGVFVAVNLSNGAFAAQIAMVDGPGAVVVVAVDLAGNVATIVRGVLVDTVAPQIVLTSPASLATNRSAVVVSGLVSERVAALLVNGQAATVSWPAGSFSLGLTLADGTWPIQVIAVDFAANVGKALSGILVDTTAPSVTVTSPPDKTETDDLSVEVRGTVDDRAATVVVNDVQVHPDSSGAWRTIIALTGSHQPVLTRITVYAVDAVGNRGNVVTRDVTYTSPVPGLQEGLTSLRQDITGLRDFVTYGLLGVFAVLAVVQAALYTRLRNRVREREAVASEGARETTEEAKTERKGES